MDGSCGDGDIDHIADELILGVEIIKLGSLFTVLLAFKACQILSSELGTPSRIKQQIRNIKINNLNKISYHNDVKHLFKMHSIKELWDGCIYIYISYSSIFNQSF